MKLTLDDILSYIDDFTRDSLRQNYPLAERIRDINYSYFATLDKIDRLKGNDITKTTTSENYNDIVFNNGDYIKPLVETTEVSFATVEYDGEVYNLTRFNNDDSKKIKDLNELDNGRPKYYILRDKNIQIFPKTDKDNTKVRLYQSDRPAEFTSGDLTAEPVFNEAIHMLLVFEPVTAYYTKRDMAIPRHIVEELARLDKKLIEIYSPTRHMKISFKHDLIR